MVLAEHMRDIEDFGADSLASPSQLEPNPDEICGEELSEPEQEDVVMQGVEPQPSNINRMHSLHKSRQKHVVRSLDLQAISMHDWD